MKQILHRSWLFHPVAITFLVMTLYVGGVFWREGGDPYAFVRIGSNIQQEHSVDEEGYDGQFVYFIAREPDPKTSASYLDVPAYRYQRILLPMLARLISFSEPEFLPWALIGIGFITHLFGVGIVTRLLTRHNINRYYGLVYGLFAGLLLAVRLDLPEPLTFMLIAAGISFGEEKPFRKWVAFGLAVFAKEVALLFVAGQLLVYIFRRQYLRTLGLTAISVLPFTIFQGWLLIEFGQIGIGSGGAMSTPFEWIPFMGWLRIGAYGLLPLIVFGIIILPFFYIPTIWAVRESYRAINSRLIEEHTAYLFFNAAIIPFLPFSTVREPGGLFRFGTGLMLSVLLYGARHGQTHILRYTLLWLTLSVILVNS